MKRVPVDSGMIKSIGYDPMQELLQVEFKNGDVWNYSEVPPAIYEEMMEAASVGSYFHKNIKKDFTGVKVG